MNNTKPSHFKKGLDLSQKYWSAFFNFFCNYLEMHIVKIVSFSIMALCCYTVNAIHFLMVILIILCLMFGISAVRFSFNIIGPLLGALFLSKMMYQTDFVPDLKILTNCSTVNVTTMSIIQDTIYDPKWWGYEMLKEDETLMYSYQSYIIVLFVMTFQAVIKVRQKISRIDAGEPPTIPPVMYYSTTRKNADENLKECLKYLINYGFYKFGVEITLSFCVFLIAYRMDIFSLIYAIWVAILFLPQRSTLSLMWPFFFSTLALSVLWQYTMAVGLSVNSCINYPWSQNATLTLWLFLPSFDYPPQIHKTLVDFVLLLLVQRQQSVFELERRYGSRFLGGSNKEIYMEYYSANFINPTPDHTGTINSWLDVLKFLFMSSLFRVTLAFEFWNGASNANILSLGYLVGAFVFLWIDYDLCLWHIKKILKWWNVLLGYTVIVILLKTLLDFCACVYGADLNENASWLIHLLFLKCSYSELDYPDKQTSSYIYWDFVCFTLIIFQRRYFQSYYFLHEVDDVLGVFRIQAKGAKLMDELQQNKLKEFYVRERKTLSKIKKNMNRIKAWQKRMHGFNYNEKTDHATAVCMGDYYMFEDLHDVSSTLEDSSSSSDEYEYDEYGQKRKVHRDLTVSEFLGNVLLRGVEDAVGKDEKKADQTEGPAKSESRLKRRKKKEKELKEDEITPKQSSSPSSTNILSEKKSSLLSKDKSKTKVRKLIQTFLNSAMVSMIRFFKKYSQDYRYIQAKMKAERKLQKLIKRGESYSETTLREKESSKHETSDAVVSGKSKEILAQISESGHGESDSDINLKKSSQSLLVELINTISMFIMSKTELLCFIIIFLHTALTPSLISLPLPLLVFLWGSLTTLRPTTTFWTVLIAYTEITVVIKALFQNSFFPWNNKKESSMRPEYPPLFLGIHRDNQYVVADLFLLLLLFLHRYKLKTLGLWNRTHEEETLLPQNLHVYKELPSKNNFKDKERDRSLMNHRKRLMSEVDPHESVSNLLQMSTWRCTSRATAKLINRGNKTVMRIRVKEIEGPILVTHDGRRLEPTFALATQLREESLEGNVVLRVYVHDILPEPKSLLYRLTWVQHFTSVRKFFVQIMVRDWRVSSDYYTVMFVFEFLDFLIVFFGYTSFTESKEVDADEYFNLAENQVPTMYLIVMILHFLIIIIDRILYLRKNVIGKLILQFLLVILLHVWMFILVPLKTESPFNQLIVPQTYYIITCFYLLMSAYQLRVGYPLRVQGHFLCKKYGYFNYYSYKGLQLIPFFNQIRIILDFLCTKSSLCMGEWIKMESIFQIVYENKCCRRADIDYPVPRGQEYPKSSKLSGGIFIIVGIIIVIWLPFIIFALFNTVAQPNVPQEAQLNLEIGNFGRIFLTRATFTDIILFKENHFTQFQNLYKNNKKIWSFLSLFDYRDLAVLKFRFKSYGPWTITSEELNELNTTVQQTDVPISMYLVWNVFRIPRSQIEANAKGYNEIMLKNNNSNRNQLIDAFLGKNVSVNLEHFLPKFIHVTNEGEAKPVTGFLSGDNHTSPYRNMTLSLQQRGNERWWKFVEIADDPEEEEKISKIPFQNAREVTIYTFNEKNIPKLLLHISKRGIIGLYLSIVLVIWTFVKRLMFKYPYIMFDVMPNPDHVLKLCHDIYLARESHEFELEEDLYAKIIFLFRSPETMIKVTRLTNR